MTTITTFATSSTNAVPTTNPTINLRLNPEHQLKALLEKMADAISGLPIQHQKEVSALIRHWEYQFFSLYKVNSIKANDLLEAANALLNFRMNNVNFIMLNYAQTDSEKVKWLYVFNEMEVLAKSILPPGTDVNAFIKTNEKKFLVCKLRYRVDQSIREIIKKVKAIFDQREQLVLNGFNQANAQLEIEFEAIRKLLLDLNSERKTETDKLHTDIDVLTETVTNIYQNMKLLLNQGGDHGNKIRLEENSLNQLLDQCEAACSKVKGLN